MKDSHMSSLLPGERITLDLGKAQEGGPVDLRDVEERYVAGETRIVIEQARYPLKQIPDLVSSADYNLQPDFQRRPRWSPAKQSRLIESFIINVPVPPIFLYEADYSRYEVMDGRQRLTAISDFYGGSLVLEGLTEWPELNGLGYAGLPDQIRRGIDRRYLSSIVLLHETAKSAEQADRLKQLVFERINTGGEDLSPQEKRNALYPGRMNSLCIELARLSSFARMWDIPSPLEDESQEGWVVPPALAGNSLYRSMGDAELVLRFFAHRQRSSLWKSGTRLDDYLTQYLIVANHFPAETIEALRSIFTGTANLCHDILGDSAFWIVRERGGRQVLVERPTLIAYDPLMWAFSQLLDHAELLRERRDRVAATLEELYLRENGAFDGRRVNATDVNRRNNLVLDALKRVID